MKEEIKTCDFLKSLVLKTCDFLNSLVARCEEMGFVEKDGYTDINQNSYYDHDYSAINMIANGVEFDVKGKVLWLDIPYKNGVDGIKIQLCVRVWDDVNFKLGRWVDVDSVVCKLLFIDSNSSQGWHNIKVYEFNPKDIKKIPPKRNRIAKDYINKVFSFSRSYHFLPSEALLDKIVNIASELDLFLNQRQENDFFFDVFKGIREEKTTSKKRKIFCSTIKPLLKERFGDIFKIR